MKLIDIFRCQGKKIRYGLIAMGVFTLLSGILWPFTPGAHTDAFAHHASHQDEVMALYLYNFLLFVEWPEGTFQEDGVISVHILGNDALFESLKPMMGKTVQGKKLTIARILEEESPDGSCHVLFIDSSKKALVRPSLKRLRNRPVLTVSNLPEFTDMGGMVIFKDLSYSPNKEVQPKRFKINLTAVEKAGLKIGSRLLRLSDIVHEGVSE